MAEIISKKEFYENRGKATSLNFDKDILIRYKKALNLAQVKESSDILDIGCNKCVLKEMLYEKGIPTNYYGIDIALSAVNNAKNIGGVIINDASKGIPFKDNSFDYIFTLEILEHIENPTFILREIRRTLRKNGTFILSVPNPYYWSEIIGNIKKLPETELHISSFTYQTLRSLIESVGFEIIDICGTYIIFPFSKRLLGRYEMSKTNSILTRSYIYKLKIR